MHYLVLLYDDEGAGAEPGTPEFEADLAAYAAFDEVSADHVRGGAALEMADRARTVRADGGAVTVSDGPFAETVEVLGGYYVLEASDLDAAVELAARIPASASGGSEVRPIPDDGTLRAEGESLPDLWLLTVHAADPTAVDEGAVSTARDAIVAGHRERVVRAVAVHPTASATTVRVRDGRTAMIDGPYPDISAVVGLLLVVQGTVADAEDVARDVPLDLLGDGSGVEVRPIVDLSQLGE